MAGVGVVAGARAAHHKSKRGLYWHYKKWFIVICHHVIEFLPAPDGPSCLPTLLFDFCHQSMFPLRFSSRCSSDSSDSRSRTSQRPRSLSSSFAPDGGRCGTLRGWGSGRVVALGGG